MDKRVYFKTLHNIKRHNQIIPKFKSVNCNLVAQKKEMRFFLLKREMNQESFSTSTSTFQYF